MIKLLNKEGSDYEYMIYDLETEYINGLRRVLYSNLKSHRIDKNSTVFLKNNTCINNEIIAHRLTLIPIKTDEKINFELKKKNITDKVINIYSDDLYSTNKNYKMINKILLHKLQPSEEIELRTSTIESSGKDHSSFKSFSVCHFKIMKFVYVKNNIDISTIKDVVNLYDDKIEIFKKFDNYKLIGYTNEIRDNTDPFKKILKKDEYMIKEIEYNNKFVYYFAIELYFEDDDIIKKSIQLLKDDLTTFNNLKMEIKNKKKNIKILIEGGSYHILNILSKYLRNNKDTYSVYNKEHPLRNEILLEYRLTTENEDYKKYLNEVTTEIQDYLSKITFF